MNKCPACKQSRGSKHHRQNFEKCAKRIKEMLESGELVSNGKEPKNDYRNFPSATWYFTSRGYRRQG